MEPLTAKSDETEATKLYIVNSSPLFRNVELKLNVNLLGKYIGLFEKARR